MKKALIVITVVAIALLAASTAAFSFGGPGEGFKAGPNEPCIMDSLSGEKQEQFMEIITDYQDAIGELREKMKELREKGDYEAFLEVKEERIKIMEEKQEQLSQVVPEELRKHFETRGHHKRNHGWDNSGWGEGCGSFNRQNRTGQAQ